MWTRVPRVGVAFQMTADILWLIVVHRLTWNISWRSFSGQFDNYDACERLVDVGCSCKGGKLGSHLNGGGDDIWEMVGVGARPDRTSLIDGIVVVRVVYLGERLPAKNGRSIASWVQGSRLGITHSRESSKF